MKRRKEGRKEERKKGRKAERQEGRVGGGGDGDCGGDIVVIMWCGGGGVQFQHTQTSILDLFVNFVATTTRRAMNP